MSTTIEENVLCGAEIMDETSPAHSDTNEQWAAALARSESLKAEVTELRQRLEYHQQSIQCNEKRKNELDALRQEKQELEQHLTNIQHEQKRLHAYLHQLQEDAKIQKRLAAAREALADQLTALKREAASDAALRAELSEASMALQAIQAAARHEPASIDTDTLSASIDAANERLTVLTRAAASAKVSADDMARELTEYRSESEKRIAEAREDLQKLRQRRDELQEQWERLKEQHVRVKAVDETLNAVAIAMRERQELDLIGIEEEIRLVRTQRERAEQMASQLNGQLAVIRADAQIEDGATIAQLQNEIACLRDELSDTREQFRRQLAIYADK